MRYKVGDKVRIKLREWYEQNKDELGEISCSYGVDFVPLMADYCGKEFTIKSRSSSGHYELEGDVHEFEWTDDMIECLVEESENMTLTEEDDSMATIEESLRKAEREGKRYDIAKTILAGIVANTGYNANSMKKRVADAVKYADLLIEELEKKEGGNND